MAMNNLYMPCVSIFSQIYSLSHPILSPSWQVFGFERSSLYSSCSCLMPIVIGGGGVSVGKSPTQFQFGASLSGLSMQNNTSLVTHTHKKKIYIYNKNLFSPKTIIFRFSKSSANVSYHRCNI